MNFDEELAIDIILHSLPPFYDQFKMTYHLSKEEVALSKIQGLLITVESGLNGKTIESTPPTAAALVIAIGKGKEKDESSL